LLKLDIFDKVLYALCVIGLVFGLKTEEVRSSETSVILYRTVLRKIPEHSLSFHCNADHRPCSTQLLYKGRDRREPSATETTNGQLRKLTVAHPVKKFPGLHGTRMFITVFTTTRHWTLSSASCIQSTPFWHIYLRVAFKLPSHPCLGLPKCLSFKFSDRNKRISDLLYACYMPCPIRFSAILTCYPG
jgi:hypothetical protein